MRTPISIAVNGASGRMGQAVLHLASENPEISVVATIVRDGSSLIGTSSGEDLAYVASLDEVVNPDVLIDFSNAQAFDAVLELATSRRIALVSGTTGLAVAQQTELKRAAQVIPVLWSANFSLGVAVLARVAAEAARALRAWDCEIVEAHHRDKKDAPSGTALALGRVIADARGLDFDDVACLDRTAMTAAREADTIGFAVVRGGDIVGEHAVVLAAAGERIELVHRATDRAIFARGALAAAQWIAGREPGLYTLADVLDSR